tara:strand:+ start:337 stop:705 length:369 start_codon:yes stop_codon:yes gene_type:complete
MLYYSILKLGGFIMIKDKKLIETTLDSLQYMLDCEDDYIPFDEATNEYMNIFNIDLEDDNILWGDGNTCILKDIVMMSRYILDNSDPNILLGMIQLTDDNLLKEYVKTRFNSKQIKFLKGGK